MKQLTMEVDPVSVEATQPLQIVSCPPWCSPLYCDAPFVHMDPKHRSHPVGWLAEEGDVQFAVSRMRIDEEMEREDGFRQVVRLTPVAYLEVTDLESRDRRIDIQLTEADRDRLVAELLKIPYPR